jgi:pilus assembly protein Flp/PilA
MKISFEDFRKTAPDLYFLLVLRVIRIKFELTTIKIVCIYKLAINEPPLISTLFIEKAPLRPVRDGQCSVWCIEESSMNKFIARFAKDESGATAIEYGLIAAFIGIMLTLAMPLLRNALQAVFTAIQVALQGAA